ncbi:hypothetical protein A2841_02465 [Candidatus Kaiserbacteria bacterium RIFCSPHIGHO2_01_FULL_48_10]|uniref:FAD/NAD(P)-binding domain-containing protein n=1 Tax=Candidatus Kaiserbacteria bacterium RIFCSPHIGHO2_01_FULL_48_10 TaxID=1798476 RepID=A0A1F6C2P5_9BACT|nr:MAG: hypothetical protein A2841_02465 [Candidatus Kaiserbacteria bacterium RIFCSPHIGHO2_01_FULL_48_10]
MYDVAIIGGGPAGAAAGVYAARKLLKTILITESFGGQSIVSAEIQNWIGTEKISGEELAKALENHVRAYAGETVDIEKGKKVTTISAIQDGFQIKTDDGKTYDAKTVLVTTGGQRRKLKAKGAEEFEQKGISYCASCDGPLFGDMDVAVIGGGNAGFETAAQLLAYCKSVTLLQHSDSFSADPVTVKKVLAHPNMKAIMKADTVEVTGDKLVTSLAYKDKETGEEKTIPVSAIFVEIGMIPSTEFLDGLVELDQYKRVIVNRDNQRTTKDGIWAAGDCTNSLYHQNNIAAGEAVTAIEDIYVYLKT